MIGDFTPLWSFEGLFSLDDIFKVGTFDKTFQRQTKKKKILLSPHLCLKNSACPKAFHRFIGNKAKCSSYLFIKTVREETIPIIDVLEYKMTFQSIAFL